MHNSWHPHKHKPVQYVATTVLGELKSHWLSLTFYILVASFATGLHYVNEVILRYLSAIKFNCSLHEIIVVK